MSGGTVEGEKDGIRWVWSLRAGWWSCWRGVLISPILRLLHGLLAKPPIERGEFTASVVVVSLVSGFVSCHVGGYVVARMARYVGGKHGALTAAVGLIAGIILAVILSFFGIVFAEGVALPPASFGLVGTAPVAGLVLFLTNLFGAYVGGRFGEPTDICASSKLP